MRLEQLRYFTQIAHDRSFTTAAENLYISQPSLSSSIASLEKELGYDLFRRSRTGAVLTEKGRLILPIVDQILAQAQLLYALNDQYADLSNVKGRLTIDVVSSFRSYINQMMPEFLARTHHNVQLTINVKHPQQIVKDVNCDACDLGIFNASKVRQFQIDTQDFELIYLLSSSIYFIVHRSSPLAQQKYISLSTAFKQKFSVLADGEHFPILDYLFASLGTPQVIFSSIDFALTLNAIKLSNSLGVILSHSLAHGRTPLPEDFCAIPLREPIKIDFYVYYRKALPADRQSVLNCFLDCFEKNF